MSINTINNAPLPVAEPATARAAPASAAKAAPAPAATPAPATQAEVRQAASQVNKALQRTESANLEFSVEGDNQNKQVVVRVVDSQTKEVIRQIPSAEMMAISQTMDKMSGLLIQQKA